jgi:hypothetical protein
MDVYLELGVVTLHAYDESDKYCSLDSIHNSYIKKSNVCGVLQASHLAHLGK